MSDTDKLPEIGATVGREVALHGRKALPEPVFDADPEASGFSDEVGE